MKKIRLLLSLSLLLAMCLTSTAYASSPCSVSLQNKIQLTQNEEFSVNVVISDIQDLKGIYGLSAVLQYDKNCLEYLRMEKQEGWDSVSYNKANGKLLVTREGSDYAKSNQTVFKIIFRTKAENKANVEISLTNLIVTNGSKDNKLLNAGSMVNIGINDNSSNESNPETNNNNNNGNLETNSGNNNSGNNSNSNIHNSGSNNNSNINNPESNNSSQENNENNEANNSEEKSDENNQIIDNVINQENDSESNSENTVNQNLPNTGNNKVSIASLVFLGIILLLLIATILYIKK